MCYCAFQKQKQSYKCNWGTPSAPPLNDESLSKSIFIQNAKLHAPIVRNIEGIEYHTSLEKN